jgi:hypothetical protein
MEIQRLYTSCLNEKLLENVVTNSEYSTPTIVVIIC